MTTKKPMHAVAIAALVVACALAVTLVGCGEDNYSGENNNPVAVAYGVPGMPVTQGIVDMSSERALKVLENFEYREKDGEGQWTADPAEFDVLDSGTYATLDTESSSGKGGWVMTLSAYEGSDWRTCTAEDIEAGVDLGKATVRVFPLKGAAFEDAQAAAEFFNTMCTCTRGAMAFDTRGAGDAGGTIAYGITKNTSGAVCRIIQESPGLFVLDFYPKSQWADGSYDDLLAECKKQAEADGCEFHEFKTVAPLFEDTYLELD